MTLDELALKLGNSVTGANVTDTEIDGFFEGDDFPEDLQDALERASKLAHDEGTAYLLITISALVEDAEESK